MSSPGKDVATDLQEVFDLTINTLPNTRVYKSCPFPRVEHKNFEKDTCSSYNHMVRRFNRHIKSEQFTFQILDIMQTPQATPMQIA